MFHDDFARIFDKRLPCSIQSSAPTGSHDIVNRIRIMPLIAVIMPREYDINLKIIKYSSESLLKFILLPPARFLQTEERLMHENKCKIELPVIFQILA